MKIKPCINTAGFIEQVSEIINNVKARLLLVDGIKYHKISELGLDGVEDRYAQTLIEDDLDHGYSEPSGAGNLAAAINLAVNPEILSQKFLFDVFGGHG